MESLPEVYFNPKALCLSLISSLPSIESTERAQGVRWGSEEHGRSSLNFTKAVAIFITFLRVICISKGHIFQFFFLSLS